MSKNWRIEASFYLEAESKDEAELKFSEWIERTACPNDLFCLSGASSFQAFEDPLEECEAEPAHGHLGAHSSEPYRHAHNGGSVDHMHGDGETWHLDTHENRVSRDHD